MGATFADAYYCCKYFPVAAKHTKTTRRTHLWFDKVFGCVGDLCFATLFETLQEPAVRLQYHIAFAVYVWSECRSE